MAAMMKAGPVKGPAFGVSGWAKLIPADRQIPPGLVRQRLPVMFFPVLKSSINKALPSI